MPSATATSLMLAVPQPFAALIAGIVRQEYWEFDRSDLPLRELSDGQEVAICGVPGWNYAGLGQDGLPVRPAGA